MSRFYYEATSSASGNCTELPKKTGYHHLCPRKAGELGYHVIPLVPNSKLPQKKSWQRNATTTPYWNGNYGITPGQLPDGSWLVVLDLDKKKGKDGVVALNSFCRTINVELPECPKVTTPSGGLHLYFRSFLPLRNATDVTYRIKNQDVKFLGFDVRGKGGYVVGPGSRIDGIEYFGILPHAQKLPMLPMPFVEALYQKPLEENFIAPPSSESRWAQEALQFICVEECSYHEWMATGAALYHAFEEGGYQIWRDWSASDPRSGQFTDEQCQRTWKSFKRDKGPKARLQRHIYSPAIANGWVPPAHLTRSLKVGIAPSYDIKQLSKEDGLREIQKFFVSAEEDTANYHLLIAEPGLGKTNAMLHHIRKSDYEVNRPCLVVVPTHAKANELVNDARELGIKARMIVGRNKRNCLKLAKAIEDGTLTEEEANLFVRSAGGYFQSRHCVEWAYDEENKRNVCNTCPFWNACNKDGYYAQSKEAASLIIITHAHLIHAPGLAESLNGITAKEALDQCTPIERLKKKPCRTYVDEDIFLDMLDARKYKRSEVQSWQMQALPRSEAKKAFEFASRRLQGLAVVPSFCPKKLSSELEKMKALLKIEEKEFELNFAPNEPYLYPVIKKGGDTRSKIRLLEVLIKIAQGSEWADVIGPYHHGITLPRKKQFPKGRLPLGSIFLDATGDPSIAKAVLQTEKVRSKTIRVKLNAHIMQTTDRSYSNYSLKNQPAAMRDVLDTLAFARSQHKDVALVGPKQILKDHWIEITKILGNDKNIGWFGGLRGLNRFKDCKALVVFGWQFPPTDDLVNAGMALHGKRFDEPQLVERGYALQDQTECGVLVYGSNQNSMQKLIEQYREMEILQAIGRIRAIHRSDRVPIYVLGKTPLPVAVDKLYSTVKLMLRDCGRIARINDYKDSTIKLSKTSTPDQLLQRLATHEPVIPLTRKSLIKLGLNEGEAKRMRDCVVGLDEKQMIDWLVGLGLEEYECIRFRHMNYPKDIRVLVRTLTPKAEVARFYGFGDCEMEMRDGVQIWKATFENIDSISSKVGEIKRVKDQKSFRAKMREIDEILYLAWFELHLEPDYMDGIYLMAIEEILGMLPEGILGKVDSS